MFVRLARLMSFLACEVVFVFCRVRLVHRERVLEAAVKYPGIILTGNHVLRCDALLLTRAIRSFRDVFAGRAVGFWAKKEIFAYPVVGLVFRSTQTAVALHRRPGSLTHSVIAATRMLLHKHQFMIVFMQGSTKNPSLRFPKTGAVRVAMATGAAVVPVGIVVVGKASFFHFLFGKSYVMVVFGHARIIPPVVDSSFVVRKKRVRKITDDLWAEVNALCRLH